MDTKIYVMAPTEIEPILDPMYDIIVTDTKEPEEEFDGYLRGMYDLWKGSPVEIIGICDWKHFFIHDNYIVNKEYIENTIQKYPIIVDKWKPEEKENSSYQLYLNKQNKELLEKIRNILEIMDASYVPAFDFVVENKWSAGKMMWITTKKLYDAYCTWLFSILFELKNQCDAIERQFVGLEQFVQILFQTWLYMQPENIHQENVKEIETKDFQNDDKKMEMKKRIVELKLDPLIQLYEHNYSAQTLVSEKDCDDDFGTKIPVWVCWWQGEEQMPPLVKMCFKSIKQSIPKENTELRLITLDNCYKYVSFSDAIIQKFKEGKISLTHLSDILRAELLYRYGGMWLDATYFFPRPFPAKYFQSNSIFTVRFERSLWNSDITKGNWSGNFWIAPKKHKLFRFLLEAFFVYWELEDTLLDYFLIDDILSIAYERFPDIREELEQCPYSTQKVFDLINVLNEPASEARIAKIKEDSPFYKLSYKIKCDTKNLVGEKTIYGYLLETEKAK